jgi:large subunit ribosomal protein L4e
MNYFSLPSAKITNPDVTRLINSSEIQSVVRPANAKIHKRPWTQHKNPLVNKGVLFRLNPYAKNLRRQELREYDAYHGDIDKLIFAIVKQDRLRKKSAKKQKQDRLRKKKTKKLTIPNAAGKEFLSTLLAP